MREELSNLYFDGGERRGGCERLEKDFRFARGFAKKVFLFICSAPAVRSKREKLEFHFALLRKPLQVSLDFALFANL